MLGAGPVGGGTGRRIGDGGGHLGVVDHALLAHGGEHELAALGRGLGIARRRQARRRLQETGKQCRLRQGNIARRLVEIAPRRGLHAIGAGAEIDAVEIHLQDLVLGILVLQPKRQQHFLHLALQRAFRLQEQVLGELLRQG